MALSGIFQRGSLLGPVAPGLSGAVNPLAFIGSGMATGNMGGALGQMANIQQQAQQNALVRQQMAQRQAQFAAQWRASQIAADLAMRQRAAALEMAKSVPGPQRERAILAAKATPDKFAESFVNQEGIFAPTGPGVAEFVDVRQARENYIRNSGEWENLRSAYERMASARPTGPGDQQLMIAFMKMQDPTSAVLENERATIENAGGIAPRIRNTYNRLVKGDTLTPAERAELMAQAQALLANPLKRQLDREREAQAYGQRFGIRPEDITPAGVIGPYREGIPEWTSPVIETAEPTPEADPVDAIQAEAQARIDALKRRQEEFRTFPR